LVYQIIASRDGLQGDHFGIYSLLNANVRRNLKAWIVGCRRNICDSRIGHGDILQQCPGRVEYRNIGRIVKVGSLRARTIPVDLQGNDVLVVSETLIVYLTAYDMPGLRWDRKQKNSYEQPDMPLQEHRI
jgi:hypothetical protein